MIIIIITINKINNEITKILDFYLYVIFFSQTLFMFESVWHFVFFGFSVPEGGKKRPSWDRAWRRLPFRGSRIIKDPQLTFSHGPHRFVFSYYASLVRTRPSWTKYNTLPSIDRLWDFKIQIVEYRFQVPVFKSSKNTSSNLLIFLCTNAVCIQNIYYF